MHSRLFVLRRCTATTSLVHCLVSTTTRRLSSAVSLCKSSRFFQIRTMASASSDCGTKMKALIAVGQMTSTNKVEDNFEVCKSLVERAAQHRAQAIFLPEACDYIGESIPETLSLSSPLDGSLVQEYKSLAKQHNIWISLGGIHEKVSEHKVSNAHVLVSNKGEIAAVYRKAHMFDIHIPEKGIRLKESDYVEPGAEIVNPVSTSVGKIGLGICYDMRFPELSLKLRFQGAEILTYPSAFTFETGAAHWETILKCRAIETQCYVVAAAQTGAHNKKRRSFGHAMVVDPWGSIIAQCSDGPGLALAEINLEYLLSVRRSMPVAEHRRPALYPSFLPPAQQFPEDNEIFQFGQVKVTGQSVIFRTPLTIAFTNKKCVVPGHVLVCPIRVAKRLKDLSREEIADMFEVASRIEQVMEKIHDATSTTVTVQDGPEAGQTITHVHTHILPRKKGDFLQNDEIYFKLQNHDKVENPSPWRTEEEMAAEAKFIRTFLP